MFFFPEEFPYRIFMNCLQGSFTKAAKLPIVFLWRHHNTSQGDLQKPKVAKIRVISRKHLTWVQNSSTEFQILHI